MENILQFERRFPGARVFRLEENYRSSGAILNVASRIVGGPVRATKNAFSPRILFGEAVCYLAAANLKKKRKLLSNVS